MSGRLIATDFSTAERLELLAPINHAFDDGEGVEFAAFFTPNGLIESRGSRCISSGGLFCDLQRIIPCIQTW
jgi:hypothetical protein